MFSIGFFLLKLIFIFVFSYVWLQNLIELIICSVATLRGYTEKKVFDWLKGVKNILKYFKTKEPLFNKFLSSCRAWINKKLDSLVDFQSKMVGKSYILGVLFVSYAVP